jgi:integrase
LRRIQDSLGDEAGPYVFPGRGGKGQLTDIRRQVRNIVKKAGLPDDFRPLHGLRHTFASALASSGEVDMYTLQKLLTHGSPQNDRTVCPPARRGPAKSRERDRRLVQAAAKELK